MEPALISTKIKVPTWFTQQLFSKDCTGGQKQAFCKPLINTSQRYSFWDN